MVQLWWSGFFKIQFTKPLGSSLGVNQMCTKKNDHALQSESAEYFKYIPQKGSFEKKIKFDHSHIFSWLYFY
jgi:hypothetical protein